MSEIIGTPDADRPLTGTEDDDVIRGLGGHDILLGLGGDDLLDGGPGVDDMRGGAGDDTYIVDRASEAPLEASDEGRDSILLRMTHIEWYQLPNEIEDVRVIGVPEPGQAFEVDGNNLDNEMVGSDGFDILDGEFGDDVLIGGDGFDVLIGGNGDDRLDGGLGADEMDGGEGSDIFYVDDAGDVVIDRGRQGLDTVIATGVGFDLQDAGYVENLTFEGTFAGERIGSGNGLNNRIAGSTGVDILDGRSGDDELYGLGGNDRLFGGLGDDRLAGGDGNDTIDGGAGDNLISGDAGADTLIGGAGSDRIYGGDGDDRLEGLGGAQNHLDGGAGDDYLNAGTGDDNLLGGADDDTLRGGAGRDLLFGEAGVDNLDGGANGDYLIGGEGDDRLRGGSTGSGGADKFVFAAEFHGFELTAAWGDDVIADFQTGRDKLDLGGHGLTSGDLVFQAVDGDGDRVADDLRISVAAEGFGTITLLNFGAEPPPESDFLF